MVNAEARWIESERFLAEVSSNNGPRNALVIDATADRASPGPMELVLLGLCGCTAVDVVNILSKKREPFTGVRVRAQGERAEQPPKVYRKIHLVYTVEGPVSRKAVEDAVRLSKEKYCSVSAMLQQTAEVTTEVQIVAPGEPGGAADNQRNV